MAFTEISRELLQVLRPTLIAKLNDEFKAQGLSFNLGTGRFDAKTATFKLEISLLSPDGKVVNKPRADYEQFAKRFGCEPEWLDKTFQMSGKTYKVTGLRTTAPKNCVFIADVRTGKSFVVSPNTIRLQMGLGSITRKPLFGSAPSDASTRAEIERRIADLQRDNPEAYYADGEHRSAGMSEKQIHDMHFSSFERQLTAEKLSPMNLHRTSK